MLSGFQSAVTRESPRTKSFKICSRFPSSSGPVKVNPVAFPSGRAKLATSPALTGSPMLAKTMGIVLVACLAARV